MFTNNDDILYYSYLKKYFTFPINISYPTEIFPSVRQSSDDNPSNLQSIRSKYIKSRLYMF